MEQNFPVDGNLIRILPRASATLRNPDVQVPTFYHDSDGRYLEIRVEADAKEKSEVALVKRIPLDDISPEEWEELKKQYANLDLNLCTNQGVSKGLENIEDPRYQRLFIALLTYLNPRQVAILLYLYKEAAKQTNSSSPVVSFRTNDLLQSLGYKRQKDGSFQANLRAQLHRDLYALHQIELVLARSFEQAAGFGAKVTIKTILSIKEYIIDNVSRDFDPILALNYTNQAPDEYIVELKFFEGISRSEDYILFPSNVNFEQKQGRNTNVDYKSKLKIYLSSRLKWDRPDEKQYLTISKTYLFKNLELFGKNSTRNNEILWRTIQELKDEGYILQAHELPGKRKKMPNIQIQVSPEKIRLCCKKW